MHIPNIKPVLIGVAATLGTLYLATRFLPGAAARAGLIPRPWNATQANFYEPFGLRPLSDLWKGQGQAAKTQTVSSSSGGSIWDGAYGNGG